MTEMPDVSSIFRSLGDPTRRALFERVCSGRELHGSELREGTEISQPAISQHLKILREAGLISERKQGRRVCYSARPASLTPLIDWVQLYSTFWQERFGNLRGLLKEIDP
jgi:DNA-binding transcriptional ArsR family regulator